MLRSGKERLSDFDRLWFELDDHLSRKRRNMWLMFFGFIGAAVGAAVIFALIIGEGDALGAVCPISFFGLIFGIVIAVGGRARLKQLARKIEFAKEVSEAFADDFHPARKIQYYLDLRHYDVSDKRYWSGRSMHGNAKYKYLDRWLRLKFFLIDGTRVVVERKGDLKVRKGSLIRHKRRVYLKVYPSEKAFGAPPFQGDSDLDGMIRQAIRSSFHDPPEVVRVRREGPQPYLGVAVTQLDAPILGEEVVALVEAILLYLQMKRCKMWRAVRQLSNDPDLAATRAEHEAGVSRWLTSAKLKLVDGCNLRCFMCDYWKRDRSGELSTEEVLAVLDDLAALGCQKVHYTGGELFLRKDAVQLVQAAADRGMRTNLTTNGTALDKPRLKALLKVPARSITLSLDSPVNHVHDRIRGRPGAWKRTVRTLDKLLERRGPKTRIRVNTVVSRRNVRTLVQMVPFLRERPIDGWLLIPVDGPEAMTADDIRFYNARIAPVLAEATGVPDFDPWVYGRSESDIASGVKQDYARGYYRDKPCHIPWFHTLIGPSGDVYPCCQTHRRMPALGNVREQSLREIFAGPGYQALRKRMLVERLPHCAGCDDFLAENQALDALLAERLAAPTP